MKEEEISRSVDRRISLKRDLVKRPSISVKKDLKSEEEIGRSTCAPPEMRSMR